MQLLQDTFIIEQLQVLSEGKDNGPMRIRGVFGRCNEKNNNGRIYPTSVLESQLAKVKPLISERRLCGELDHPANDTVKLSNASHLITKLDMKGDELIGEAEILRTPAGLTAKALVEGGVKIGISSRGMGTLSEDHNGDKIVNEDFRLVTFDLVADPSTRGAYPGMCESVESKFVKDSQSKLTKESNFVTMLNSKMRDAYKPFLDEWNSREKHTNNNATGSESLRPAGWGVTDKDRQWMADNRADREKVLEIARENRRKREAAKKAAKKKAAEKPAEKKIADAFELVKADGHWHRIADAIAEGFGKKRVEEAFDDLDNTSSASRGPSTRNLKAQALASRERAGAARETRRAARETRRGKEGSSSVLGSLRTRLAKSIQTDGSNKRKRATADSDNEVAVAGAKTKSHTGAIDTEARNRDKVADARGDRHKRKIDLSHTAYKQIGSMLAEIFNLKEEKKPVTPKTQLGNIRRNPKGKDDQGNPAQSQVGQKSLGHGDSRLKGMQDRAQERANAPAPAKKPKK